MSPLNNIVNDIDPAVYRKINNHLYVFLRLHRTKED